MILTKRTILLLTFVTLTLTATAQTTPTARLDFEMDSVLRQSTVLLNSVTLKYQPAPSIGLSDVQLGEYEINRKTLLVPVPMPQLFNLIMPKKGGQGIKQIQLFLRPNDALKIKLKADGSVIFEGETAAYQQFLEENFLDKVYAYLPALGYKPTQPENQQVLRAMDSLQQVRQKRYDVLKASGNLDPTFDVFVQAMLAIEPYKMQYLVASKQNHSGGQLRLTDAQDQMLKRYTLDNFKLMPDDALLYHGYRDELKQYITIKTIEKFPLNAKPPFELSGQAIQYAYQISDELLRNYPRQREYLLTHWLDYATTRTNDTQTAPVLLADYRQRYPKSELIDHFDQTLSTKSKLVLGELAPDLSLRNRDGALVSLRSLIGKPVLLIFCYNLRQHELLLKPLEEKYGSRMTFLYLNVTPGISLETWQSVVSAKRTGVEQLYASEQEAEQLKNNYWGTMAYPFVIIDAAGKVTRRWIPQEFPDNATLQKEVKGMMGEK
jgi:hypothetical protein